MITQELAIKTDYRTSPKLQVYTAENLLRFADETDKKQIKMGLSLGKG